MKYKYADFIIEIAPNDFKSLVLASKGYESYAEKIDKYIEIDAKDISYERSLVETGNLVKRPGYFHSIAVQRELAEWMPLHKAFIFHSATFDVDGTGVAFAARSGTGKTTHMLLWQKLLGDRLKIVNGDKPIVRYFDDEPNTPYAYGTPWNGKEHLGCNMRTPLKHICFIERAEQNSCEKMDKNDAVNLIFNQVYMPKDPAAAANTIVLINRLISDCSLWKIKCNMDISAAETAYRTIFGE